MPLRFRLCVVVSMCVYMGVGVCVCVWMRVFKLSQARNLNLRLQNNIFHGFNIYI